MMPAPFLGELLLKVHELALAYNEWPISNSSQITRISTTCRFGKYTRRRM